MQIYLKIIKNETNILIYINASIPQVPTPPPPPPMVSPPPLPSRPSLRSKPSSSNSSSIVVVVVVVVIEIEVEEEVEAVKVVVVETSQYSCSSSCCCCSCRSSSRSNSGSRSSSIVVVVVVMFLIKWAPIPPHYRGEGAYYDLFLSFYTTPAQSKPNLTPHHPTTPHTTGGAWPWGGGGVEKLVHICFSVLIAFALPHGYGYFFSPCDMVLGLVAVLVVLVISNINSSSYFLPPLLVWGGWWAISWFFHHLTELFNDELPLDYSIFWLHYLWITLQLDWAIWWWATSWLHYHLTELFTCELPSWYSTFWLRYRIVRYQGSFWLNFLRSKLYFFISYYS